jgi:hypothetical protein
MERLKLLPISLYAENGEATRLYLSRLFSSSEIVEMKDEYLIGMALIRAMCKRVIFAFDNNEILFEA